jgi:hypothetical protein
LPGDDRVSHVVHADRLSAQSDNPYGLVRIVTLDDEWFGTTRRDGETGLFSVSFRQQPARLMRLQAVAHPGIRLAGCGNPVRRGVDPSAQRFSNPRARGWGRTGRHRGIPCPAPFPGPQETRRLGRAAAPTDVETTARSAYCEYNASHSSSIFQSVMPTSTMK